jgi:tRNA (guanine-N7-)-methyltransferase
VQDIKRKIRSFVRREGRMTPGQAHAFESYQKEMLDMQTLFGNNNPVALEIGFGMGASLVEQAKLYPNRNYIGIEVHRPGVGSLLVRMKELQVANIRVISHDAVEVLADMIPDHSLQLLQLFFPDPWHKKRHHKRRIVNQAFADLVRQKLVTSGHFHMATDWQNYAEHMLEVMVQASGWKNCSANNDFIPKPEDRPVTKFQRRGEGLGHGVWDLMFEKV